MYNSKPIVYQASLITAQTLLLVFNCPEKAKFSYIQPKILETTMLLLLHIQLLFAASTARQKNLSSSVTSLTLFGNIENCALIARIFPGAMLKKVDADKRYTEWEPTNWKEFFALLQNNYNTVTEQWNEVCREELISNIQQTVKEFLKFKYDSKRPPSRAKWNYEEFEMIYQSLEPKCLVGKYYISELILYNESHIPYLKENISDALQIWSRLFYKFLNTNENDQQKQKLILTAMVLIYTENSDLLRECEILPYFIHLLEKEYAGHLQKWILKLILATVKAKNIEICKANYKIILKNDGVMKMLRILCMAYRWKKSEIKNQEENIEICCCIVKIINRLLKIKENMYFY